MSDRTNAARFFVDAERCAAHEWCVHVAPSLFEIGERAYAHVVREPSTAEELVLTRRAIAECPVSAIVDRDRPRV